MPTLEIEVEEGLAEQAEKLFPDATNPAGKLARLALREWVAWLRGELRPMTISEQNIERIIGIYGEVLVGDVPDASTLYNEFNIPLGQARYLVQAISYRRAGLLYSLALQGVGDGIDGAMVERAQLPESDRDAQTAITIRIPRVWEKTLEDVVLELCYEDDSVPRPEPCDRVGKYSFYTLRVRDVDSIRQSIDNRLESSAL